MLSVRILRGMSNLCIFLAGLMTGIFISVYQIGILTRGGELYDLNAIYLLPWFYYIIAVVVAIALTGLLRMAAREMES
ncbi:MAG: hypothetical protein HYV52_01125 [Parcubacteria group bacterium]|nr:hypothetical protein [Parcubacteria group bacterium]